MRQPYPRRRRRRVKPLSVLTAGLASGISVGLLFGLSFQAWLYLEPMFAPPPRPDFSAPAISLFLDGDNGAEEEPTSLATPSPQTPPTPATAAPGQRAQVTEPIGLVLRSGPSREAEAIGGVAFEEFIVILERDGEWERIRRELNDQEGWVRAGNAQGIDGEATSQPEPESLLSPELVPLN